MPGLKEYEMKHRAMAIGLVGVLLAGAMVGCEKERASEEAVAFDPNLDAPPSGLVIRPDPDLLRDQADLAAEARDAVAAAQPAGAGPTTSGGGQEDAGVAAVRAVMGKLIGAAKAGQGSIVLDAMAEDSQEMRDFTASLADLAAKVTDFNKAVADVLALPQPPASIEQAFGKGADGGPILARLGDLATNAIEYETDGNTVSVKDGTETLEFSKDSGGAWKIQVTDAQKRTYAALGELLKAQAEFAGTLTAGIRQGGVTKDNVDQKVMELYQDKVKPALEAVEEARQAAKSAAGTP